MRRMESEREWELVKIPGYVPYNSAAIDFVNVHDSFVTLFVFINAFYFIYGHFLGIENNAFLPTVLKLNDNYGI